MPLKKKAKKKVFKKKVIKRKPALKKRPVSKKKTVVKKKPVAKKKPAKKSPQVKKVKENIIGKITHYFPHVQAAVIKLKAPLVSGETIKVKGHTTDFTQTVGSMQMDHVPINEAKKGQEIGLQVVSRVRQHDVVIKV